METKTIGRVMLISREMAATDLCTEIEKGAALSASQEKCICRAYITQLSDTSLNVQGNAVKCISRIGSRISEVQFGEIANKLTECVVKGTEEFRDIYATCLKTLISEADETFGKTLCNCLLPPLTRGTEHKLDTVREQCIEIANEVLKRFSSVLAANPLALNKDVLMDNLIKQLPLQKPGLRKRACACLGSLAVLLNAKQISYVVTTLLKNVSKARLDISYTYIEAIGAIASTVGYKLAPHASEILNSFKEFCIPLEGMDAVTADQDFSIKDVCLTVFESMVKKCPKEITPYLETLISMVMKLIGYDPNYNADVMIDGADEVNFDEWGAEDEQIEDDASWKVRRAAIKLLDTLVRYRYDKIKTAFDAVLAKVVERLVEREDTIKCLLLETFIDLARGMVVGSVSSADALETPLKLERKNSAENLAKELPGAITQIVAHYGDKSMKVRETIASVLLNMAFIIPDYMNGVLLSTVLPKLFLNFKENSSTTKITVFQTLRRLMLMTGTADGYTPYLSQILETIALAMKEDYFKLSAEALATAGVLMKLLMRENRPPSEEARSALLTIHKLCVEVLKHADVDQEIKQAVIYAAGIVAANATDILPQKELDELLSILQDRMKYEALRLACIKAFHVMVSSDKNPPIEKGLEGALPEIVQMSRKVVRQVKLTALETLLGVCRKFPALTKKFAAVITENLPQTLKEGDLQLTQLALKILVNTIPFAPESSLESLMEALMSLCSSSLFQTVLDDAVPLLSAMAKKNKGNLTEVKITEALWNITSEKTYKAISIAIASILSGRPEVLDDSINKYTGILASTKEPELKRKTSAIIIGCLGQRKDLSKHSVNNLLLEVLKGNEEDLKISAAICLGNIALGNGTYYIPLILSRLKDSQELSYLMLLAIREVVLQDQQHAMAKELAAEVLPALRDQADTDDEGDRTIIAEIVGRLFLVQPAVISSEIEKGLANPKDNVRATFVLSFKYLLQRGEKEQFSKLLPQLLPILKDKSLRVQKALLDSLTNIARQNSVLLRPYTAEIQAGALALTTMRPELVKVVDLGPLQHRIDEGQPARKGAYTLLENMVPGLHDKMDLAAVLERAVEGLNDESDEVQNSCQETLIALCEIAPETVLTGLEKLMDCVVNAINKGLDRVRKKVDVDRTMDGMRSFLRVVVATSKLEEAELNQKYQDSMAKLVKDKTVLTLYEELSKLAKT